MYEAACEPTNNCDNDQFSFKAYLSRWLAKSAVVYPSIAPSVRKYLTASAQAACKSCTGGADGQTCGEKWYVGGYDGVYGIGQELSAMETVQSLLLLDPSSRKVPRHQENVKIQVAPVTSTFTLTTNAPTSTPTTSNSSPDSSAPFSSSGNTNIADRASHAQISWTAIGAMVAAVTIFGGVRGLLR